MEAKVLEHLERTHGHLNMLDECIARWAAWPPRCARAGSLPSCTA
jgi:ferritin-like metal-binding protein YciE